MNRLFKGDGSSPAELAKVAYPAAMSFPYDGKIVTLIRHLEMRWFGRWPKQKQSFAQAWSGRHDHADPTGRTVRWTCYHAADGRVIALASCETRQIPRAAFHERRLQTLPRLVDPAARPVPELNWGPVSMELVNAWHQQVPGPGNPPPEAGGSESPRFLNGVMRFALLAERLEHWLDQKGVLSSLAVDFTAPVYAEDRVQYTEHYAGKNNRSENAHRLFLEGRNQQGELVERATLSIQMPQWHHVQKSAVAPPSTATVDGFIPLEKRERIALTAPDGEFTWQELHRQTAAWAERLRRLGAGPGTIVAVHLGRHSSSIWVPLALAMLRATYFPLHPEDPPERLASWLAKAKPGLVLTERALLPRLPQLPLPVYVREAMETEETAASATSLDIPPDRLIGDYLMGTSGSLGEPKLVHISSMQLQSYLAALAKVLPVSPEDVCLHTASFAFSASIRQLHLPLWQQSRLVLAGEDERRYPRSLLQLMKHHRVTLWDTVPSVWKRVIEYLQAADAESADAGTIANVFLTGEPLTWSDVQQWRSVAGRRSRIFNLYSQTETAGSVACYQVPEEAAAVDGFVPCGLALPDVEIRIVDEAGRNVPDGETGEVWVTGPRHKASRFPELDGSRDDDEARFAIHTGDLARASENGDLEIVGRRDRRVKIRGLRVDLDEIERTLLGVSGVREAAVTVDESANQERHLHAYVVSDHAAIEDSLRKTIRERLSQGSMPKAFFFVDKLPRTASGKIAWIRLRPPEPGFSQPSPTSAGTAVDDLEKGLIEIWERVLKRKVPREASFRDLGGDSLAAVDVLTAVEAQLRWPLPLELLHELTTVAEFASRIRSAGTSLNDDRSTMPTPPRPIPHEHVVRKIMAGRAGFRRHPGSLILRVTQGTAGRNHLFFCANSLAEVQPLAAELEGLVEVWMLESGYYHVARTKPAIQEMARWYLDEIVEIAGEEPVQLMGYSFACLLATEIMEQLQERGVRVSFLGWIDNRNAPSPAYRQYRRLEKRWESFISSRRATMAGKQGFEIRQFCLSVLAMIARGVRRCWFHDRRVIGDSTTSSAEPYRTKPSNIPIHLFLAREHRIRNYLFPTLGWKKADHPNLHVWRADGNHDTIWQSANVITLGRLLRYALAGQPPGPPQSHREPSPPLVAAPELLDPHG